MYVHTPKTIYLIKLIKYPLIIQTGIIRIIASLIPINRNPTIAIKNDYSPTHTVHVPIAEINAQI